MKTRLHFTLLKACFLMLSCLLFVDFLVAQQQSPARPYVLFSNDKLEISSSTSVAGGTIASKSLIKTTGNSLISAKIQSGGRLELNNSNTVDSVITVANTQQLSGTIMQVGSNSKLNNKIDVKGNIVISGGTVKGPVNYPAGINFTYSGPTPSLGFGRNPITPNLPSLDAAKTFPAPDTGRQDITSGIITPGVYRNLIPNGGKTITFSGTGIYIFHSIKNSGNFNNYVFDFKTNTRDLIRIYVFGDVDVYKVNPTFLPANTVKGASRIYMEVLGTGVATGSAWSISNGASGNTKSVWHGTVYAPNGNINVGQGSSEAKIIGALWSGKQITIQSGVNVVYSPLINDDVIIPFNPIAGFKYSTVIGAELTSITQSITEEAKKLLFISDDGLSILIDVIAINGHQTEAYNYIIAHGMTGIIPNGVNTLITTGYYPISNLLDLNDHGDIIDFCQPVYRPIGNSGLIVNDGDTAIGTHLVRNGYNLQGTGIKIGVISDSYNSLVTSTDDPVARDIETGDLPGPGNPVNSIPVQVVSAPPYPAGSDEGRAMLQIVHDIAPKAQLYFRTGFRSPGDFAQGIRELQQVGCNVIVDDITYINEPFLQDGPVARMVDSVKSLGVSYFTSAGNFSNTSHGQTYNPVAPPAGFPAGTTAHNFRSTGTPDIYQRIKLKPGSYTIALQWEDSIYSTGITHSGTKNDFDMYLTDTSGNIICGYNRDNTLNVGGDPFEFMAYTVAPTVPEIEANLLITRANTGTPTPRFKYIIFRGGATIMEYQSDASTIVGQANAKGAITVAAINYFRTPAFPWPSPDRADSIAPYSSIGGTLLDSAGRLVDRHKPDITAPDGVNTSVNMGPDLPASYPADDDPFSNFFGTSAAAPHAAATAALLIEGRRRFLPARPFTPDSVKAFLKRSALHIPNASPYAEGSGLIQADVTMRTFASPTPAVISLAFPSTITPTTPPTTSFVLTVYGNFFTGGDTTKKSEVLFRGVPLPTTFVSTTQLTAIVPAFTGNPTIQVYTPPIANGDGGYSNSVKFFSITKKTISIKADNKTKKYGEQLPVFTSVIRVNNVRLDSSGLTLQDVGLQNLTYATNATPLSNVGNQYFIKPIRSFDTTNATDVGLLEIYTYDTIPGILTITKLPVQVIPDSQSITYGDALAPITFTYKMDSAIVAANPTLLGIIQESHQKLLTTNAIGVIGNLPIGIINGGLRVAISNGTPITITNGGLRVAISNTGQYIPIYNAQSVTGFNGTSIGSATIVPYVLSNAELANISFFVSDNSLLHSRLLLNNTQVIDVAEQSLLEYRTKPDSTIMFNTIANTNSRGILGAGPLAATANGGLCVAISNGGGLRVAISNGSPYVIPNGGGLRVAISNGGSFVISNGGGLRVAISNSFDTQANRIPGIPVIIDSTDLSNLSGGTDGLNIKSLNVITGLTAGLQKIIPGTVLNDNFDITYGLGNLRIRPAVITVKADDVSKRFLDPNPPLTVTYTGFKNGERFDSSDVKGAPTLTTSVTQTTNIGTYPILVGAGTLSSSNYTFNLVNGTFTVLANACLLTRDPFNNFGSTPTPQSPTSLWVDITTKVSGQLKTDGRYLLFTGGSITLNDIIATDPLTNAPIVTKDIPNGKIIADHTITDGRPHTHFDFPTNTWITQVPVGFASTSDIFISGAIINSSNGFVKKKNNANSNTVMKGIFFSDTNYSDQWTYGLATYRPVFTYASVGGKDSVQAINGTYRAGTPITQITHLVNGGSGGGNNYTGSSSSFDNFTACLASGLTAPISWAPTFSQEKLIATGEAGSIQVIPNPATSYITLSFVPDRKGNTDIELFTIDGRKVFEIHTGISEKGARYDKTIDVSKLLNGIYLVQLRSANKVTTKKIIIAR